MSAAELEKAYLKALADCEAADAAAIQAYSAWQQALAKEQ